MREGDEAAHGDFEHREASVPMQGRACIPHHKAPVWLQESAVSGAEEE